VVSFGQHKTSLVSLPGSRVTSLTRYSHAEPVVKSDSAFRNRSAKSRHSTDVFGDGEGIWEDGVNHLVG